MEPSNLAVLIELAGKREADSIAFVLRSLQPEPVDDDHLTVLRAALDGLAKVRKAPEPTAAAELQRALRTEAEQVGLDRFVGLALEVSTTGPYLAVVLSSLHPSDVADLPNETLAPLAGSVTRSDLGTDLAVWCADVVEAGSPATWLLTPLLRGTGRDGKSDDGHERLHQRSLSLVSRPDMTARVRDELLADAESDVLTRVGALRLLAASGDPSHVNVVAPFVEDLGAWTHISRAMLTPERLEALASTLEGLGLDRMLSEARSGGEDSSEVARRLAADPKFHTAIAKLMGGRAAMFGFGRLLIDPRFLGALKHLVSDVDAPVRVAAAMALGRFGSEAATPYLLTGVMDRHKDVRRESQSALRTLVGDEAYQSHIDELQTEVGFIRERLQGATEWAKQASSTIERSVTGALAGVKSGAAKGAEWVGESARRVLWRKKE